MGAGNMRDHESKYSEYRKILEEAAAGWFQTKGHEVLSGAPYLLRSRKNWSSNIIVPAVAEYVDQQKKLHEAARESFPLHKYIHHGLSSQAMGFNLFGPLLLQHDLAAAKSAFGDLWPEGQTSAEFEVDDRAVFNEMQAQPTSIDIVINGPKGGQALFIEAKLAEQGFGGCSVFGNGDCAGLNPAKDYSLCYLHQIKRTYWENLEKNGFLEGPLREGLICPLAVHYQFFREFLFAIAKEGKFVLLHDGRSPVFFSKGHNRNRGLMPLLMAFVPDRVRGRVSPVTIQAVVRAIKESGRHNNWIQEFESKYGLA